MRRSVISLSKGSSLVNSSGSALTRRLLKCYQALGWRLTPCNGKAPLNKQWHDDDLLPAAALDHLAAGGTVGLVLGPCSGLVDVEHDSGQAGEEAAEQLGLPPTVAFRSPRGVHRLYRYPAALEGVDKGVIKLSDVEVRLGNKPAATIVPPSAGRQWLPGCSPLEREPAELPERVVEALLAEQPGNGKPTEGKAIVEGERNTVLTSLAGRLRRAGLSEVELLAALLAVNKQRCSPPLPEAEVATIAASIARYPSGQEAATAVDAVGIAPPWPEPWPEPVELREALDEALAAIHRHVVLSREAGIAAALWVAWSYAVDRSPTGPAGDIAPLLLVCSPVRRCGKTQLLSVLAHLCPRVVPASNVSAAALYRLIEVERPTLLIDEADLYLPGNDALRCILNAAHRRELSYVVRCSESDRSFRPQKFSVWGPKCLAMIGSPPPTTLDRSVVIRLQRKRPDEAAQRLGPQAVERLREISRRLMRAVGEEIRRAMYAADPEIPAALNDRQADNWRSLLALADLAGGHWPAAARNAAVALAVTDDPDAESIGLLAIADSLEVFANKDRLPPAELVSRLTDLIDRPWRRFSRGLPLTAKALARLVAQYGIVARKSGNNRFYHRTDFQEAASRYNQTPPPPETICPSVPSERKSLQHKKLRRDRLRK